MVDHEHSAFDGSIALAYRQLDSLLRYNENHDHHDDASAPADIAEDSNTRVHARAEQEQRIQKIFITDLPHEVLLSIVYCLPQRSRIHMAQVSQQWRKTLHSRPELWKTMYIRIHQRHYSDSDDRVNMQRNQETHQLEILNNQIKFYEARLPVPDTTSLLSSSSSYHSTHHRLEHLSIHSAGLKPAQLHMLMNKPPALERLYNMCTSGHRFTINLKSISLSNFNYDHASQILENWVADSNEQTIISLRIALPHFWNPENMDFSSVERFSRLNQGDFWIIDEPVDAVDDEEWPETQ